MNEIHRQLIEENYPKITQQIRTLWKIRFEKLYTPLNQEYEDFEARALLELCRNVHAYNSGKKANFTTFCSMIINNKMKTYATALNRDKRKADIYAQSLNQTILDGNDIEMIEQIADKENNDTVIEEETEQAVQKIISVLPLQERKILYMRYNGAKNEEISDKLKLDRKYVDDTVKHFSDNAELRRAVRIYLN